MAGPFIHCGGMVTPVGLSLASSCAAMRGGLDAFNETRIRDKAGEWLLGAEIDLEDVGFGRERLKRALAMAVEEALGDDLRPISSQIPLLLCVAEPSRGEDDESSLAAEGRTFLADVQARLSLTFHPSSAVLARGRVGGIEAIQTAITLLSRGLRQVIVAGVDSYLEVSTLAALERRRRIKTTKHSDGFIPGEAAAAVVVSYAPLPLRPAMTVLGIGLGKEPASVESGEPLRGVGLNAALGQALAAGRVEITDVDYRITTVNGESYFFREAILAMGRLIRRRREEIIDLWHSADAIGDTGAAGIIVGMNVAAMAAAKDYAPGPLVMLHASGDDESRAAMLLGPTTPKRQR
jgi:3-oxoacyl-[acyl-carrier-protein] synthase I